MENFKNETQESARDRLVRLMVERGAEDSEVQEQLQAWYQDQQNVLDKEREASGSSEEEAVAMLQYEINVARLYMEAGLLARALEAFRFGEKSARNEGPQFAEIQSEFRRGVVQIHSQLSEDAFFEIVDRVDDSFEPGN